MQAKSVFSNRKRVPSETHNKHRVAFPSLAKEVIRISDVILEVLDARDIENTRNIEFEKIILELGKKIIFVVNKADLVDVKEILSYLKKEKILPYVLFSCETLIGRKRLRDQMKIEVKRIYSSGKLLKTKRAHVGIIGYPNTGKSSLINILAGRKVAGTSPKEGFTKGIMKIRFTKDILILDTPGVISTGENSEISPEVLKKQANIGIKHFSDAKNPELIVSELIRKNSKLFSDYYDTPMNEDLEIFLESVGKRLGFIGKKGIPDINRASRRILKDWQDGKIQEKISKKT